MPWTPGNSRTSTTEWRKIRRQVLARDPVCTVCHKAPSTRADHITPHSQGGPPTLDNLRGVCVPCHAHLTAAQAARARWPTTRRRPTDRHPGRP